MAGMPYPPSQFACWLSKNAFGSFLTLVVLVSVARGQSPPTPVTIQMLDGTEYSGALIAATHETLTAEIQGERRELRANEILRLGFASPRAAGGDTLVLTLVDGSRLRGTKLVGKESGFEFADSSGASTPLGPGVVKSLLVRPVTGELAAAWQEAVQQPVQSDALVLLRPGNATDVIQGVIGEVKDGKVAFELDGQSVDVPFDKLVGVLWFRKALERMKPSIELQLLDSGVIQAATFELKQGKVVYRGPTGIEGSIPIQRLAFANYASANLRWIADLPILESKATHKTPWKEPNATLDQAMAPRFHAVSGESSGNAASDKYDLEFLAPGSFTFRVPEGFQRFRTSFHRVESGDTRTQLDIEVWQDDEKIVRKPMSPTDDSIDIDCPVTPGKKIRLVVVGAGRLNVGSHVVCRQPRLMR